MDNMRKVAQEYDLFLIEDNHVNEVETLKLEILNLKARLSRALNPDAPQYTDEEMNVMSLGSL